MMHVKFDDNTIKIEGGDTFCVIFEEGLFSILIYIEIILDRQP